MSLKERLDDDVLMELAADIREMVGYLRIKQARAKAHCETYGTLECVGCHFEDDNTCPLWALIDTELPTEDEMRGRPKW